MSKKSVKNTPSVKSSSRKRTSNKNSRSNDGEINYFLIAFWIMIGLMVYEAMIETIPQETRAEWYELY